MENYHVFEVDALANLHTHLREIDMVGPLVCLAVKGGADVLGPMPNTIKPLINAEMVMDYINHAKKGVPSGSTVQFVAIAMITEQTTVEDIVVCVKNGIVDFKILPRFRTTQSDSGVVRYGIVLAVVKEAAKQIFLNYGIRIKVHTHPEHPSQAFGNRDAEFAFLQILYSFVQDTVAIIISEHGTDARCIPSWKELAATGRFYVTLTAHHLAANEDQAFGDVRSVCKPPIKTESDRLGLINLVEEDHPWVMAGPDDAPHDVAKKHVHEGTCACGSYTSPFLHPLYAHGLDNMLMKPCGVDIYNRFTSRNSRMLHGLQDASRKVKLIRRPTRIPSSFVIGSWNVEPFWAGREIKYGIVQ